MAEKENIPQTIDEYILKYPKDIQDRMNVIRQLIHKIVPTVQEKISWGMPTFFIGKKRMHLAANKMHLGLYPGIGPIVLYKEELATYKTSKGTIQLPYSQPLPIELITKLIKAALISK